MDLLRTQAQNLPASIKEPLVYILGPQCFKTLVLEGHVSDAPCLQFALSKGLSLGMVAGRGILKVRPSPLTLLLVLSESSQAVTSADPPNLGHLVGQKCPWLVHDLLFA